jgi:hypothetical protein
MVQRICHVAVISALIALNSFKLGAQLPAGSSSQATVLLSQSLAVLTHGKALMDAKLEGAANFTAGSDEEAGPATLEASGYLASKVALNLSGGQRLEIQNGTQADWSGPDGQLHPQAFHNSLNWAAWFFPPLAIQGVVGDPSYSVTYIGPESLAGSSVQHLRVARNVAGQATPSTAQILLSLTTADLYLDTRSLLPVSLEFNIHPDYDELQNLPVRIEYQDYRTSAGVQVPFHIRKYLQGSLLLDITVNSLAINSGVAPGDFQIQ